MPRSAISDAILAASLDALRAKQLPAAVLEVLDAATKAGRLNEARTVELVRQALNHE